MDKDEQPITGATIKIKDSTTGALTDIEGFYKLELEEENPVLIVSFMGYITQEVKVGKKSILNIQLEEDTKALDEVVVTAFGIGQKKESLVGAIQQIRPEQLRVPSSRLSSSFAGRLSGVIAVQRSGEPGADGASFWIRGASTFSGATDPLIILDGVEIDATQLNNLDPEVIESFSILKDATATALYGTRGANGVMVVTTKNGENLKKPIINFRVEGAISQLTNVPKMVDGITYMRLYNEAQTRTPETTDIYSDEKINATIDGVNPYMYPNIDWYNEMFKKLTYNQHYTLNANGGGKVARYSMAVTYDKDTGILKENRTNNFKNNIDIDRFNLMAKVNINLTRTTRMEVNMNSVFENYTGPVEDATTIFNNVMNGNPVEFPMVYEPDEEFAGVKHILFGIDPSGSMTNPYAQMVKGYKDGFTNTIISQFTLEQDLDFVTRGLMFRGKASIATYGSYESKRSYDPYLYALESYDELNNTYTLARVHEGTETLGDPETSRTATSKTYYEVGLHYNRNFNDKHDVGAVLIYTQEEDKNTSGGATIQATLPARNQGVRGRVTYAYDGRYMMEASLTYNGSEKFDRSKRWGLFPAIGVGYMISGEKFWEPLREVLPTFKLKYSWGRVGNDEIASATDRFFFLSDIAFGGAGYRWGKTFTNAYNGFSINRYANPNIQWEISEKQNVGLEMNLLHFADIQVEYFTEYRSRIYMERQNLPPSMGMSANVYGNLGEVKSNGIDASIDIKHSFNKDLYVTGRFNFTYAHGELVVASEPEYKYPWRTKVGHPVNQAFGYVAERLFIDADDVANSPTQSWGTTQAGDIKYKDINNDGQITDDDQVPLGYPTTPEINYGFGLSIGWKGFDLSAFFQGQDRVSFFINAASISPFVGYKNAMQIIADDHWSPDNPVSDTFWPRLSASSNANNTQQSTWWIRNGAILRMKTLEFGYSLSDRILKKTPLNTCRIYFSGLNLFKFSKFDLWDPEMGTNGLGYPLQRVFSLGLQITF